MSDSTDLKIAELLHQENTYRDIQKALHVSAERIGRVKEDVTKGIIAINEEGKAFLAMPAQKTIEEIHEQVMDVVTKKATETALQNAELDYALGNEIRQYWTLKAQELGMTLRDFVRGALVFYDDYKDELEKMKEKLEVADTIVEMLKRDVVRISKMELYYKFVRYCLYLKSQGMEVTPALIHDFYQDLTVLEKGGELEIVGGRTVG